ncbi:hypothetical protein AAMO2058_000296600 [Amorphochlora amoebiformis]|mmetsp:Transcript_23791/g.37390  ORF Transcript_23791/g.37390 Transcript_23791/m.37390 type:complete len:230 (-) Transcript_23791:215-904(-)
MQTFGRGKKEPHRPHQRSILRNVIEFLQSNRKAHSIKDIGKAIHVNLSREINVISRLRNHERVEAVDEGFRYKPEIANIFNKQQLCAEICRINKGLCKEALEDAYVGADEDLQALIDEGRVFTIRNSEKKENMYFGVPTPIVIHEEIKKLWLSIKVPREADVNQELIKSGQLKQSTITRANTYKAQKRGIVKRKKGPRKKQKRGIRLTNVHMLEKHEWLRDLQKKSRRG